MNVIFIDIGNSKTKIAYLKRDDYKFISSTFNKDINDDFFKNLVNIGLDPNKVYFASVSSAKLNANILKLFNIYFNLTPYQLKAKKQYCGFSNGYKDFFKLGVDRWLSMIAVFKDYDKVIVLSAGTAITVDLVIKKVHKGGFIVPGLNLMQNSLFDNTSLVNFNKDIIATENNFLPTTTKNAVLGGTVYMVAAFLNTIISEIKEEEGNDVKILSSGGDFLKIQSFINHDVEFISDLVIKGMLEIYKHEQ